MYWAAFMVGLSLHLLLQMQVSIRSSSNGLDTGLAGMWKWFQLSGIIVAVRVFLCVLAFSVWRESPNTFGSFVQTTIPVSWATAGIFGFAVDSFVDKAAALLGLKVEIPALVPPKQPAINPSTGDKNS